MTMLLSTLFGENYRCFSKITVTTQKVVANPITCHFEEPQATRNLFLRFLPRLFEKLHITYKQADSCWTKHLEAGGAHRYAE
jgi:hypothetical protein